MTVGRFVEKVTLFDCKDEGLALGGGIENAIVVGENEMMAQDGLRYADECIRHKILDALGDLS